MGHWGRAGGAQGPSGAPPHWGMKALWECTGFLGGVEDTAGTRNHRTVGGINVHTRPSFSSSAWWLWLKVEKTAGWMTLGLCFAGKRQKTRCARTTRVWGRDWLKTIPAWSLGWTGNLRGQGEGVAKERQGRGAGTGCPHGATGQVSWEEKRARPGTSTRCRESRTGVQTASCKAAWRWIRNKGKPS